LIAFLTLYLGLIAGRQPFELRVDPAVKRVNLYVDGNKVETIAAPPWRASVDLGDAIQPHEIVAQALDRNGHEIARASQLLNLPRATAELEIVLDHDAKGMPRHAALTGHHISYADVRRAALTLDLVPLTLDRKYRASLPAVDMRRPHVLAAEMRFADRTVARREVVFGGSFGESMPAELTPVAVTTRADVGNAPDCFVSHGEPLRVSNVAKEGAVVIAVRDPDPADTKNALHFKAMTGDPLDIAVQRSIGLLDRDTTMELMSPAADRVVEPDQPTAVLFPSYPDPGSREGLYWFLTTTRIRGIALDAPRRWADAVAVAAVKSMSSGRRRVVLLILGGKRDASEHSPEAVRAYLESVGVPLFVWSVFGPTELGKGWGEVEDVSTLEKMQAAAQKIRRVLDTQRIAWIYADPLTALRAEVKDGCGYARLAR